jgi:hypothetical protein
MTRPTGSQSAGLRAWNAGRQTRDDRRSRSPRGGGRDSGHAWSAAPGSPRHQRGRPGDRSAGEALGIAGAWVVGRLIQDGRELGGTPVALSAIGNRRSSGLQRVSRRSVSTLVSLPGSLAELFRPFGAGDEHVRVGCVEHVVLENRRVQPATLDSALDEPDPDRAPVKRLYNHVTAELSVERMARRLLKTRGIAPIADQITGAEAVDRERGDPPPSVMDESGALPPIVHESDLDRPAVEATLDGKALIAALKSLAGQHGDTIPGSPSGSDGSRWG